MLVGSVVGNEIENQLEPTVVNGLDQLVEIGQGAKDAVHIAVVRDVIPKIRHRRGVERRNPHGLNAQGGQVIEPRKNPP